MYLKQLNMKIKLLWLPMVLVAALFLASCSSDDVQTDSTYVYDGEGFGGAFTISINEDGSFSYYEGFLSSYIGHGKWKIKHNVLTISDGISSNKFKMRGNELVFVEEGSTNFMFVKLKDGDKFIKTDSVE